MQTTMAKVGLDVHAEQTHAAVLDPATGELTLRHLQASPRGVLDFLAGLGAPACAVYEAGPSGYGLARAASERGLDVRVVAPGLIPRMSGHRIKTDRRDAARLARLLAAGELSFVRVPTEEEERFPDLVRAREDLRCDLMRALRCDLMRARHRLSGFLRRCGLRFPGPGRAWTREHRRWLNKLRFHDLASETAFLDYLTALEALPVALSAAGADPGRARPRQPFRRDDRAAALLPRDDTLTAAGISADAGDSRRFAHPRLLAGYLGLFPSERSSDDKRRQGGIT
jgi:transposase